MPATSVYFVSPDMIEIGLAGVQRDDVAAGRLELAGLGGDGDGLAGGDAVQTFGGEGHFSGVLVGMRWRGPY